MTDPTTEAVDALLAGRTNWERQRDPRARFSLDTIRALLAAEPAGFALDPATRCVQVVGSKGKGTTAAWIEACARARGLRVGVFASPHVETVRERIRIDGELVGHEAMLDALRSTVAVADAAGLAPSAFELLLGAALRAFRAAGGPARPLDLVVLEAGLGGRLDATTAVEPMDGFVVTTIELEHTEMLGDTVAAIAREKAAALRPGRAGAGHGPFVVSGAAHPDAVAVVRARADEVGLVLDECFEHVDGPGRVGRAAAELARRVVRRLFGDREPTEPVVPPVLPGRAEWVRDVDGGLWLLDGAHTEESLRALGEEVAAHGRRPAALVFSTARGKRWQHGLRSVLPLVDDAYVPPLAGIQGEQPETIVGWCRTRGVRTEAVPDVATALERARDRAGFRVVAGSFYLIGEVRGRIARA